MPQVQPSSDPRRRRGQARLVPAEQQRQRRSRPAPVPLQEERRRRRSGSKPRRGIPRLHVFLAGIGLGYGLNGPLPHLATALLAGLHHPTNLLGSLITPAGMGERRIVVMGTDHVSTNTDVMFTVQLKDGRVTYIDGNPDHPLNKGVICAKGSSGIMKQVSPARLTRPLRRKAGAERGAGHAPSNSGNARPAGSAPRTRGRSWKRMRSGRSSNFWPRTRRSSGPCSSVWLTIRR